eukprot:scaffold682_cov363-Pavlova_lutheri.AAC.39
MAVTLPSVSTTQPQHLLHDGVALGPEQVYMYPVTYMRCILTFPSSFFGSNSFLDHPNPTIASFPSSHFAKSLVSRAYRKHAKGVEGDADSLGGALRRSLATSKERVGCKHEDESHGRRAPSHRGVAKRTEAHRTGERRRGETGWRP